MRKRICHVITGLPRAGAQRVLVDLLAHHDRNAFDVRVVSLLPRDAMADDVESAGIPLWCADLALDPALPWKLAGLASHLFRARPEVVHTWMYHGDVVGGAVAKAVHPETAVVWHLHHSTLETDRFKPTTRALASVAAPMSRIVPSRIIACAESSRRLHVERGYDAAKMVVIRNGVDTERFRPRASGPRSLVAELGLTEPVELIGLAARAHPQKDHATFLAAARILATQRPDAHFVLCGAGVEPSNPMFDGAPSDRVHLLGERRDLDELLPQLDVFGLSSAAGEACSLVLLESMASGVPCVTTDVGDSADLVGSTGRVVPPVDPEALAKAWASLLSEPEPERRARGEAARRRAVETFGLPAVARAIEGVYVQVAGGIG